MKRLVFAIAVLCAAPAYAQQDGPPPPLAGVPIELQCNARLPDGHPVADRQPGVDLHTLAEQAEADVPLDWLDDMLCDRLWKMLQAAGAHPAPDDVRLPARAVLTADLEDLQISGSRVVDQRIGGSILQVAVPHWSLAVRWAMSFSVHYPSTDPNDDSTLLSAPPLELSPRAGAEQDDYARLRLGALLEVTAARAFANLPQLIADDGRLGDLLFARVDRPPRAPDELGAPEDIADHFWQLLVSDPKHRHDALAFHLGSERLPIARRVDLAYWFLLNDSNPTLRKDVLAWLFRAEEAPETGEALSDRLHTALRWILARDGSPRMRTQVVTALSGRTSAEVRDLLLRASTDRSRDVSEAALAALRKLPTATVADYERLEGDPVPPVPAPWTVALDGRVVVPEGSPASHRLALVRAAGGPASETWLARWLRSGRVEPADLPWAMTAWASLLKHESPRVRREAIERLGRETERDEARALLAVAIESEPDAELRIAAILGLGEVDDPDALIAILAATEDDDPGVRRAAAEALTVLPGRKAEVRLQSLRDNDPDARVRRRARQSLRKRAKADRS